MPFVMNSPASRFPTGWRSPVGAVLVVLACALLAACYPTFDWRDVRDDGAVVLFPDKPQTMARNVELDGLTVAMTMQATRVAGLSFALARVALPAGADAAVVLPKLVAGLRNALARNINGKLVNQGPAAIARIERGATPIAGEALEATGQGAGQTIALQARLVGHGTRVWQIAVYGAQDDMAKASAREAVDTFLLSLRLE